MDPQTGAGARTQADGIPDGGYAALPPDPRATLPPARRWLPILGYHARVFRRVWRGVVYSRLGSPLLALLAVGWGVGLLVDRGGRGGVPWHGVTLPYAVFVVPAILASTAMMTGFGESSWPVFGAIKWQGTYYAMLATPMRTRDILAGHIAQVGWQLAAGAAVFVALAAPFGVWRSWWVLAAVPVATLTGLGFATVMTAVAARSETEGWFTAIFRVVATPLMLFSGTYFPIESLPTVLQPLAWATPLWHGVEACRALATGLVDGGAVLGHVAALVGFCAVGVAWSARELHRRLVR